MDTAELSKLLDSFADTAFACGSEKWTALESQRVLIPIRERILKLAGEPDADKARLDWLEKHHMSISRLSAPDMGGLRFMGQCFNPAKERGEAGPSYIRIQGPTLRATIDAGRKA